MIDRPSTPSEGSGHRVVIEKVHVDFGGGDVLRGLSLDVPAGQVLALLGHNGAGKTTLTRLIAALLRPREGGVRVGDWDVATKRPDEMARRVGYAFQHADQQLFARTVQDDVAFGPKQLGIREDTVTPALLELDLLPYGATHPYDLPAPMRKLVTLAGVFAMRPGVLLLDEPTAGFDWRLRELVIRAVRARAAEGVSVIAVSHDLTFVAEVADRVVTIRDGVVADDQPMSASALGEHPPAAAAISVAFDLPGKPVRQSDVVKMLRLRQG